MRKSLLLSIAVLILSTPVFAQTGFIREADKEARRQEEMALAKKLLEEKDTHKRIAIRKEMVDKDIIRDAQRRPLGDGFSVQAFTWLRAQAGSDLNARLQAVIGLSELKSKRANPELIAALDDASPALQLLALQALDRKRVTTAGKAVVRKLSSTHTEVVAAAAECLASIGYGGDGESTGPMITLMKRMFGRLEAAASNDPKRLEYQRVVEVLGRSCGRLIPGLEWNPGQGMPDLKKEIAKFTQWWNAKHADKLKNRDHAVRKKALAALRGTAERSTFPAILEALKSDAALLNSDAPLAEKKKAMDCIVLAGRLLRRIAGAGPALTRNSQTAEIDAAARLWDAWQRQHLR